jgi:hypothetical protein
MKKGLETDFFCVTIGAFEERSDCVPKCTGAWPVDDRPDLTKQIGEPK